MHYRCWENAKQVVEQTLLDLEQLKDKTIAITGSTGLIGSQLVRVLISANQNKDLNVSLILPVRDISKAESYFGKGMSYIEWNLGEPLDLGQACDFFVHTACATASASFLNEPVETLLSIVQGSNMCLKAANSAGVKTFVNLSTMEVYGDPTETPAKEECLGGLDSMSPRSSYPIGKLASENLTSSFMEEYGMRTVSLRLAQAFGAGVVPDDARVFAEFARDAQNGKDITLLTDGSKRNCYLAIDDAVTAIIKVLTEEDAKGVYNVANPNTFCSIKEMAEMVLKEFADGNTKVIFANDPEREKTFRKAACLELDVTRIKSLGWKPLRGLQDMYRDLLDDWVS